MKKVLSMLTAVAALASMTACAPEQVTLTVWGGENYQTLLGTMCDAFEALHPEAVFDITIGVQSESSVKDAILADPEAAADVFAFADDQFTELVNAGALQEVLEDSAAIITENGGADAGVVKAATSDDKLYAYPMTADNGYFMYYDKDYFDADDVDTLDEMLDIAEAAGKHVAMEMTSGWYTYSFFAAAGLSLGLAADKVTTTCNWDTTTPTSKGYIGTDVVDAILDINAHPGFISADSDGFQSGLISGDIIAGVNGTWNATAVAAAFGADYGACKLPTYTLKGDQVQMSSFTGYKLLGVSKYSAYTGYAMKLARFLTNYDNQILRFTELSNGPSNVQAAASATVQANPAIAAVSAQSQYGTVQRVGGNYWNPMSTFGAVMVQGYETNAEDLDTTAEQQAFLETLVDNITAVPAA